MRSQTQYRGSFVADVIGSLLFGVIDVTSVIVVFRVTPTLGGFTFPEVFLMTALAGCAFALGDLAVGNVERLRVYVRSGLFDALLGVQAGWVVAILALCRWVQACGERKLVIQGG